MDLASDYIRLPSSEVRLEAILSLMEGAKPLADLQADMQRRNTTILHALNDLAEIGIVEQVNKDYKLTSLGLMEGALLRASVDMAETLENFQEFWLSHDVSVIPPHLMLQIGALKDSHLIKMEEVNLGRVHSSFLELLGESKMIQGISPIFHEDYITIFAGLLEKGAEVELILTGEVLGQIESTIGLDSMLPYIEQGKLRILRRDNLSIGLTVTDKILSLGLFTIQGTYDYSMDLVSSEPGAREWGLSLYRYYREGATEIQNVGGFR
ncbi:MAG: helix-turn-helix transcriptional regulator [Candidatus Bathyarchaeia archaeon]